MREGTSDRLLNVAIALASLAVAGAVALRVAQDGSPPATSEETPPRFEAEWRTALSSAVVAGDTSAPIKVVVVSDPECPACRYFAGVIDQVRAERRDFAVYTLHIALPQHRFAPRAIRAIECARRDAAEARMLSALFAAQDSLGLKEWESFARDAGVSRLTEWNACLLGSESLPAIESSKEFVERIEVRSTPTVLISGWRINRAPSVAEFRRLLTEIARDGRPTS